MRTPWWAKIAGKLVLSRVPLGYRLWRRLGLFRHGTMDVPAYAYGIFRNHYERSDFARKGEGFVALELGPGDSAVSALTAAAHGASRTYLVDTGDYATRRMSVYRATADYLTAQGFATRLDDADDFEDVLWKCRAFYVTTGLSGLRDIPSGSVDFIWSHAVLEHVRLREFSELNRELRRLLRDDGVCSHRIDLSDHLEGGLNNLRFRRTIWESSFFAHAGFYTNRLRYGDMLRCFKEAGFSVDVLQVGRWPVVPIARDALAEEFSTLPDQELCIRWFDAVLRPAG